MLHVIAVMVKGEHHHDDNLSSVLFIFLAIEEKTKTPETESKFLNSRTCLFLYFKDFQF